MGVAMAGRKVPSNHVEPTAHCPLNSGHGRDIAALRTKQGLSRTLAEG
jgi:hypothetical protein